jgi:hypothetical protein
MKLSPYIFLLQAALSLVSGFLISKMSWIGRIGVTWFMPQYKVFKSWWQTAIILFMVQVIVLVIQWQVKRKASARTTFFTVLAFILIGIAGLYLTYNDFQSTFTHKLMKEKFHLGFYLFWLTWVIGSLYILTLKKKNADNLMAAV